VVISFLTFVLEWLLDPKFVDLVSMNVETKENYLNPFIGRDFGGHMWRLFWEFFEERIKQSCLWFVSLFIGRVEPPPLGRMYSF
jgi:hypothetical protein